MDTDFWITNEFEIKGAASHIFLFGRNVWEGKVPHGGEYIYFIQREGQLRYIGLTRNPVFRFKDAHHAFGDKNIPGWEAYLIPLEKVCALLDLEVTTLEIAESLLLDLCKNSDAAELVNKKLSEELYLEDK